VVKRGRCLYGVLLASAVAEKGPLSVVKAGLPVVVVRSGHVVVRPGVNGEGRTVLEGLDKVLVTVGLLVVVLPLLGLLDDDDTDEVYVCQTLSVV